MLNDFLLATYSDSEQMTINECDHNVLPPYSRYSPICWLEFPIYPNRGRRDRGGFHRHVFKDSESKIQQIFAAVWYYFIWADFYEAELKFQTCPELFAWQVWSRSWFPSEENLWGTSFACRTRKMEGKDRSSNCTWRLDWTEEAGI